MEKKKNNTVKFRQPATPTEESKLQFSTPQETQVLIYFDNSIRQAMNHGVSLIQVKGALSHLLARLDKWAIDQIPELPAPQVAESKGAPPADDGKKPSPK